MNKSPSIFQEIESKLAKDHYASQLPSYHPAKGRRKRVVKEQRALYQTKANFVGSPGRPHDAIGFTDFSKGQPDKPFPGTAPEIEEPGETEIPRPGEREIDPARDFPPPDIPHPDEEEIRREEPQPEVDPNRIGGM
jgi:hypothetical protein